MNNIVIKLRIYNIKYVLLNVHTFSMTGSFELGTPLTNFE